MSVGVIIEHRVRPGSRDSVRAVWEEFLRPAITENDAHEAYAYMYDIDDPDVIRAFQQYRDTEAASAFLATAAYAAYVSAVEDLLAGPPSVMRTDVMWTKEQSPSRGSAANQPSSEVR
jgi:quinol monooxygenase YgiN